MEWRLLRGVPPDELQRLLQIARRRTFSRGEVVFHREDPADSVHLIVNGRFAIRVMTPLGDTSTIAIRGRGDSFGEMALIEERRRSATVEALERAETRAIYRADFDRLRAQHRSVDAMLMTFLANEVRMLNERLLEALYVPAERRVLRRLVELGDLYSSGDEEAVIPLTQDEIAQLAGTSRATTNSVLRQEEKRATLELRRGRTVLRDLESLARRAR